MRLAVHVQDQNANPKAQDHVTFRTCINPRAVKAAERVGGAAAQYAGLSLHCHPLQMADESVGGMLARLSPNLCLGTVLSQRSRWAFRVQFLVVTPVLLDSGAAKGIR